MLSLLPATLAPLDAQAPAAPGASRVVPRTPDGRPDLQGNWSNETQTPLERMGNHGPTLTDEQAAAIEKRAQVVEEFRDQASDPNRPAPAKGGGGSGVGVRRHHQQVSRFRGASAQPIEHGEA
jgi:hypothetical protein